MKLDAAALCCQAPGLGPPALPALNPPAAHQPRPAPALPRLCPPQIRFTRVGRKKLPFYRIVAVDSKVRRDGAPLEYLGWYDPLKKEANLNAPAIKKWLSGEFFV